MIHHAKSLANWLIFSSQRQSQVGITTVLVTFAPASYSLLWEGSVDYLL